MDKFSSRLSSMDVKKFIEECNFDVGVIWFKNPLSMNGKARLGEFERSLYKFSFAFDDFSFWLMDISYGYTRLKNFMSEEAFITSNDWRCFLKRKFGEVYVKAYDEKFGLQINSTMEFISGLTHEDICQLLNSKDSSTTVIEVEPFLDGTRRFKYISDYVLREFVVAPYYNNGDMRGQIDEEVFVAFMYKRFGKQFSDYYIGCIDLEFSRLNQCMIERVKVCGDCDCKLTDKEKSVYKSFEIAKKVFGV